MAKLQTVDADASVEDVLAVLASDGGVIVNDIIGSEVAAQIVSDLSSAYDATPPGSKSGSATNSPTQRCARAAE